VIRAGGLLRQLLLDENPLVHRVNRKHRLKLSFEAVDYRPLPPVKPEAQWINLDPGPFPAAKKIAVDLDTLLRAPGFGHKRSALRICLAHPADMLYIAVRAAPQQSCQTTPVPL
jgi:hypothetical protein